MTQRSRKGKKWLWRTGALLLLAIFPLMRGYAQVPAIAMPTPAPAIEKTLPPAPSDILQAQPADINVAPSDSVPAPPDKPDAENAEVETAVVALEPKEEEDNALSLHSLFYTADEMALIDQAELAYQRFRLASSSDAQNQAKDFLNQLEDAKRTSQLAQFEKASEYPQFYLQSLVYHAAGDWIIQINGQKLVPEKNEKFGLKVIRVDQEKVLIEWKPANMQQINAIWAKAHNDAVVVEKKSGTVTFALQPNQTFSSYLMRILEGKVKPIKLENTQENNKTNGNTGLKTIPGVRKK